MSPKGLESFSWAHQHHPKSKLQDPKLQDPQPKLQDPKPKLQDPKSKIQNPKLQDPQPKPRSKTETPRSKIQNSKIKTTPAILGVQDRLQSQVYLIHLPFWGSKIGYKARCIWYTCHFGGPRSATKPGVSDTPAILGVQDRLQSQVYLIHLPFWGSKIGYKARCIWYTCHFGGPRSATKPGVSDTPAILGVRDRLQSQVYLLHLPFWGSEIGYKARCIWYTCHFGGPRSATKPGVSDTPAILGVQDRLQNQNFKIQDPKSKPQDPESKMGGSERSEIICWKGLKSSVYDFRPLVGAYLKVWPFQTLSSWGYGKAWPQHRVQIQAVHFPDKFTSRMPFCQLRSCKHKYNDQRAQKCPNSNTISNVLSMMALCQHHWTMMALFQHHWTMMVCHWSHAFLLVVGFASTGNWLWLLFKFFKFSRQVKKCIAQWQVESVEFWISRPSKCNEAFFPSRSAAADHLLQQAS